MATVYLPQYMNLQNINHFVGLVMGLDRQPLHGDVVFNFSGLHFIDGAGITVLCNTIGWLRGRGISVAFCGHQNRNPGIRYLDDCGFFERYLQQTIQPIASTRSTTIPAQPVALANMHSWVDTTAGPWLAERLSVPGESLDEVRMCLREIFNNISEHAGEDTGFVHIQHYPNRDRLGLTISDFGSGIPSVIRSKYQADSDESAIYTATEEGTSTKATEKRAGAGLNLLLRYTTIANQGNASIYSGTGALLCAPARDELVRTVRGAHGFFPGTLIDLEFRTDLISRDDETGGQGWPFESES